MKEADINLWAKEIIKKTGFVLDREIQRGYYYTADKVRSINFGGKYKNKPAILKVYDDPRLTSEPMDLIAFNRQNKSKILKAPAVYDYQMISAKKGWLIMEKIPANARCFVRPINPKTRREIIDLYWEYRKNFPTKPTRKLTLVENLSACDFHVFRINRWLQLANDKEAERALEKKKPILNPKEFIPRFEKGMDSIRKEFKNRKMVWCHGHFNPAEIFKSPKDNTYYLLDFAHTKMYPEGYELAFIVWSDWITNADWKKPYVEWKKGIKEWVAEIGRIAGKLKIKNFQSLMRASLIERCLGTILADICATGKPEKEQRKRISLIYRFLDEV
jgi:hypothetical protein